MRSTLLLSLLVALAAVAPTAHAQCTLTLSEEGIVRLASGVERRLTWNEVPGASSYMVEELIEGINDPSPPDFTFGGPYTESRNFEGRGISEFRVNHAVVYKVRFRYTVTALKREDPNWQPCKDDVLFVIEPDYELAQTALLRIVPFAGKVPGRDGSQYSTSLILAGTGLGPSRYDNFPPRPGGEPYPPYDELPKLYHGQIYFRPLGTTASEDDPHIDYALGGEGTTVYEDIMARLGTTGIGTIEVRPALGTPAPQVDAIIENRMANGTRTSVRVAGAIGRHHLNRGESATIGIRNANDTRLAIGVRSLGSGGGRAFFERWTADGHRVDTAERYVGPNMTVIFGMQELFETPLTPGQRIIASFSGFDLVSRDGQYFLETRGGGLIFLTETGNDLNNPGVIYRDPLRDIFYENGYDQFIVY